MTSAERKTMVELALGMMADKRNRVLDVAGCKGLAATLANGGAYSIADLDDALWLSEVLEDVTDAAVAEALAARDAATAEPKALTLDDIVGQRVGFCGVDNQTIVLLVDGKLRAFEVVEDEEDGYRSSLEEVREVPIGDTIHFREPVADVIVSEIAAERCDGYQFADDSGHVWLQVGTDYSCDYYPCFVFDYTPPERPVVAEALPRWVPVGERLPTYDEIVLACTSDGEIFMAEWREHDTEPGGAWWSDDDEIVRVVAWQPLPAPWVAL